MTRTVLMPYKMASRSGRALADALGIKRLKSPENSRFRPRDGDVIINWGSSCDRGFTRGRTINDPSKVALAANKLDALLVLGNHDVAIPRLTPDIGTASDWIRDEGATVFARTMLRANSGRGIVVASTVDELPRAPLYTVAVDKAYECRVHVMNGEAFDFQQKRKRNSSEGERLEHSPHVWNHGNHYVYCRNDISVPTSAIDAMKQEAVLAIQVLGLDFGAVDIAYTTGGEPCIFEVNTAPGLSGSTLDNYAAQLRSII